MLLISEGFISSFMHRGFALLFASLLIIQTLVAVRGGAEESKSAEHVIDPYFVGSWKSRVYHVTRFTRYDGTGKFETTVFLEGKPAIHSKGTWYIQGDALWKEQTEIKMEPGIGSTLSAYPRDKLIILERGQDSFSAKVDSDEIMTYQRIPN